MYDYHENGWLRHNIILHETSLSILVHKQVRIKIHLYTLPVKKTKIRRHPQAYAETYQTSKMELFAK